MFLKVIHINQPSDVFAVAEYTQQTNNLKCVLSFGNNKKEEATYLTKIVCDAKIYIEQNIQLFYTEKSAKTVQGILEIYTALELLCQTTNNHPEKQQLAFQVINYLAEQLTDKENLSVLPKKDKLALAALGQKIKKDLFLNQQLQKNNILEREEKIKTTIFRQKVSFTNTLKVLNTDEIFINWSDFEQKAIDNNLKEQRSLLASSFEAYQTLSFKNLNHKSKISCLITAYLDKGANQNDINFMKEIARKLGIINASADYYRLKYLEKETALFALKMSIIIPKIKEYLVALKPTQKLRLILKNHSTSAREYLETTEKELLNALSRYIAGRIENKTIIANAQEKIEESINGAFYIAENYNQNIFKGLYYLDAIYFPTDKYDQPLDFKKNPEYYINAGLTWLSGIFQKKEEETASA